jgi:hypothetical protein
MLLREIFLFGFFTLTQLIEGFPPEEVFSMETVVPCEALSAAGFTAETKGLTKKKPSPFNVP